MRRIIWRVKPTPGSQLALFATCRYHAFITDREGDTSELKADYRRHADVKKAIRDLNYSVGLNHLPAGRFPANAVRLAVQSLPRTLYGVNAHNVARWAAHIGWGSRWQPPRPSDDASSLWPDASPCISPKSALGKPVQLRPVAIARSTAPFLYAQLRLTRPPNCLAELRPGWALVFSAGDLR